MIQIFNKWFLVWKNVLLQNILLLNPQNVRPSKLGSSVFSQLRTSYRRSIGILFILVKASISNGRLHLDVLFLVEAGHSTDILTQTTNNLDQKRTSIGCPWLPENGKTLSFYNQKLGRPVDYVRWKRWKFFYHLKEKQ